jgi:hypothetical protein
MRQNRLSLQVVGNDLKRLAHGWRPHAEFRSGPHTLIAREIEGSFPDLPPIRRYRVRFEGYQGQADLIGGELFAETGNRRKALDQNLTNKLLSLRVTDSDIRVMTIGELLYEAAETHLDCRHPEWTAAEGTFGTIDFRFVPRLRITGKITRRSISLLTSRL